MPISPLLLLCKVGAKRLPSSGVVGAGRGHSWSRGGGVNVTVNHTGLFLPPALKFWVMTERHN